MHAPRWSLPGARGSVLVGVLVFGFVRDMTASPQPIAASPRRFAELEGQVIPCALRAVAEAPGAASDSRAALRTGLFGHQERNAGAECRTGGNRGAEEENLAPVPPLLIGLSLGRTPR